MENDARNVEERLEAATSLLDKTLNWLEGKLATATELSGEVDRISATVEQNRREEELVGRLAAAEREVAELKAAASTLPSSSPLRKTIPATTTEMLAKHGIGEGPVDVRSLDAALTGLSLEQRIAVKTQLLRAGAIA